jgi:hypothetical protein
MRSGMVALLVALCSALCLSGGSAMAKPKSISISQHSMVNAAVVAVVGNNSKVSVTQVGFINGAVVGQIGFNSVATVSQFGVHNAAGIGQGN